VPYEPKIFFQGQCEHDKNHKQDPSTPLLIVAYKIRYTHHGGSIGYKGTTNGGNNRIFGDGHGCQSHFVKGTVKNTVSIFF
jgi:hypothetical protein